MKSNRIKGIVLAGGKSSRFGQDKALVRLDGVSLLERAVELLRGLDLEPVVITNAWRDYSFLTCPVKTDIIPAKGPLGGLFTAAQIFVDSALLVLSCDMPGLTSPLLEVLLSQHEKRSGATLFCVPGHLTIQPFPGVYESWLSLRVERRLIQDQLSMQDFLAAVPEKKLIPSEFGAQVFCNVNERQDLEVLRKIQ